MSNMETVDIYVRLSIHDSTKDGLERQEADLRKWAEQTNRTIRKVWRDPGVSAFKQVERPEFANATKALLAGEVSSLLVWKLDRLSRRGAGQVGTLRIVDELLRPQSHAYLPIRSPMVIRAAIQRANHKAARP